MKKFSNSGGIVLTVLALVGVGFTGLVIFYNLKNNSQKRKMTAVETEQSQPYNFLNVNVTGSENFWGNKIKVRGIIKNTASVTVYKNAVIRVTYYSGAKTILGKADYKIYEQFPTQSAKKFELNIDHYGNVNSIACAIISASVD